MRRKCLAYLMSFGLLLVGSGSHAQGLDSLFTRLKGAISDLIVAPNWEITTELKPYKKSLIWQREGWRAASFTDPVVFESSITVRAGNPNKLQLEIFHARIPYVESNIDYRSFGSERFSVKSYYSAIPNCLKVDLESSYDKCKYGPGHGVYDPFLTIGEQQFGFREAYTESTERFGIGIKLGLPQGDMDKYLDLQTLIGMKQRSVLYPLSRELSQSYEKRNMADKRSWYTNWVGSLTLSPKIGIKFSGEYTPDERLGYYTAWGYGELFYTTKIIDVAVEYVLNSALKVKCGYIQQENTSGETYGEAAEHFGLPQGDRQTSKNTYYLKIDFKP